MLLHQLRHMNIDFLDSKVVISMLTTKSWKSRFASIGQKSTSELAGVLNVDCTTVINRLRDMLYISR